MLEALMGCDQITEIHWQSSFFCLALPKMSSTHCMTLQYSARNCSKLHDTAKYFARLQQTTKIYCDALFFILLGIAKNEFNTMPHTATLSSTLQHTATNCNALQDTATH